MPNPPYPDLITPEEVILELQDFVIAEDVDVYSENNYLKVPREKVEYFINDAIIYVCNRLQISPYDHDPDLFYWQSVGLAVKYWAAGRLQVTLIGDTSIKNSKNATKTGNDLIQKANSIIESFKKNIWMTYYGEDQQTS
jgi:hypothetical protein